MPSPARVDSAQGLFETLLVVDGRPVELDAHLRRLAESCERQLGVPLPPRARDLAKAEAVPLALGRLRLTVTARADDAGVVPAASPVEAGMVFPSAETGAAALRTISLPGGLGAHKWVDRAAIGSFDEPSVALLVDSDGSVLEASRANVFAVRDGLVLTPPADGRILPGIARRGLFEVAREEGVDVREQRLERDDLTTAEEVFLSGSVRGVQHAASLDGEPLGPAGALSRRLAAGLRRRWGLPAAAAAAPAPAAAPQPGRRVR